MDFPLEETLKSLRQIIKCKVQLKKIDNVKNWRRKKLQKNHKEQKQNLDYSTSNVNLPIVCNEPLPLITNEPLTPPKSPQNADVIRKTTHIKFKCDECNKFIGKNEKMLLLHKQIIHNLIQRYPIKSSVNLFEKFNSTDSLLRNGNKDTFLLPDKNNFNGNHVNNKKIEQCKYKCNLCLFETTEQILASNHSKEIHKTNFCFNFKHDKFLHGTESYNTKAKQNLTKSKIDEKSLYKDRINLSFENKKQVHFGEKNIEPIIYKANCKEFLGTVTKNQIDENTLLKEEIVTGLPNLSSTASYKLSQNRRRRVKAMHLECSLCGYSSVKRHHLSDHLNKHIKYLAYSCSLCSKKTYTADAMRKHLRVNHTKDTNFKHVELKGLSHLCKKKFGYYQGMARLQTQRLPNVEEQVSVDFPIDLITKQELQLLSYNSMAFGNDNYATINNSITNNKCFNCL